MNLIGEIDLSKLLPKLPWSKPPTVLVVEDNTTVQACIREAAEVEGFAIVVSETVDGALGILHSNGRKYVCAIIDVRLRGTMNGWDLFDSIKAKWPDMIVSMISIDFDNFKAIPRGMPVWIMLKNGHHYEELFRQIKKRLNR